MIKDYNGFLDTLLAAGFSMSGSNDEGIFAIIHHGWNEPVPGDSPIQWHTGDPETDPWEWRIRVLNQRDDIAYAKIFFKKGGYITRQWYPYFLAARRGGYDFNDAYAAGEISYFAKRIYDVVAENGNLPLHTIKQLARFTREEKPGFDRALVELQMGMFLTMSGQQQRTTRKNLDIGLDIAPGQNASWPSTVFCTTEHFFGEDVFSEAANTSKTEAINAIETQVLKLNPLADKKKIAKFIAAS
ncbi:MAG: hypothetical protein FWC92_00670 [Defluviitaleaceae bacterium]|nr:hypothetical protein [Defluviitaleaceae bacterium]